MSRGVLASLLSSVIFAGLYSYSTLLTPLTGEEIFGLRLLFTAPGSDEGHRAVLEALGCGASVVSYPIEGASALLDGVVASAICNAADPQEAATLVRKLLSRASDERRAAAVSRAAQFAYQPAGQRLLDFYRQQP